MWLTWVCVPESQALVSWVRDCSAAKEASGEIPHHTWAVAHEYFSGEVWATCGLWMFKIRGNLRPESVVGTAGGSAVGQEPWRT